MKTTLKLAVATACSKCRQAVHLAPPLEELLENMAKVWDKSQLLNHPYVQLKRGFVFIHVPKTAGTSLNKALGLNAPLGLANSHLRARNVVPVLKRVAPSVISVAFVRNPYARFVSLYNFARADESFYHSASNPGSAPCGKHIDYDILQGKNLEECAELLVQGKLGEQPENTQAMWLPQVEWLIDYKKILMVDFIGRVESLESDLNRLHRTYGIAIEPVPWLNKSASKQEDDPQWTERARDLVRLYYKRDFEMLGYDE
jgi:hypothetical protein